MNFAPGSTTQAATLDLVIGQGRDGMSRIARRRVAYPWSLGRGYTDRETGALEIIPQVAGAGLLPNDRVSQSVAVEAGACLRLVSPGAMLVHGNDAGDSAATSWQVELASHASALLQVEPYVLLAGGNLDLETTYIVAPGAHLIAAEGIVCPPGMGAIAYSSVLRVIRPDGAIVFQDRQAASPRHIALAHRLAGGPAAFGTVLIIDPSDPHPVGGCQPGPLDLGPGIWAGLAPIRGAGGCGVRIAATDGGRLRYALRQVVEHALRTAGKPSEHTRPGCE